MSTRNSLDRSTMFTCLLELSSTYGKMESRRGEGITAEALAAWYDSTANNMFDFARKWIKAHRPDLMPLNKQHA